MRRESNAVVPILEWAPKSDVAADANLWRQKQRKSEVMNKL